MNAVLAHGLGGRSDLPVPLWLAQYGAAMAIVVSFVALGAFWQRPRLEGVAAGSGRPLGPAVQRLVDGAPLRVALKVLGLVGFIVLLVVAVVGPSSSATNPAPTWLYVWFWVGLVPASLLFGPVWRQMNPLRTLSSGIERLLGRAGDEDEPRPLPAGLGYWPAVVGLVVFAWLELVYADRDRPTTVLVFVVLYALAHLLAAVRYGQAWYARGDAFEVLSELLGRLCPFERRADGRIGIRNPLVRLAALEPAPGLVAFICALLGSTAFDGLSRTRLWNDLTVNRGEVANLALGTLGLAASIGFVLGTYLLATRLSARYNTRPRWAGQPLDGRFVHSLLPIVLGYTIAHYFSFFIFQGQVGYILASDPLGWDWDLFGTADWRPNLLLVSTSAIALVQIISIVTGHVLGVVAAHDRAVAVFPRRDSFRGQYPLLAVMVCYTVGGIALLVGT